MKRQWMTADPVEYKLLKANAHSNRNNMTEAESAFWALVKGKALGEKCLRQHVVGPYILDFLFRKSRVIVEIDGGYHNSQEQQMLDAMRTEWLEKMGFHVIRFTNEQVLFEPNSVISKLKVDLNREI